MTQYTEYKNKRGEVFVIASLDNGSIIIRDSQKIIFRASAGWTIEQAKKWVEL